MRAHVYIDRSADLFPAYKNANTMLAGISAEKYKYDRDLTKLLVDLKQVAIYRPDTEYLHQYLDYLNQRSPGPQLVNFYLEAAQQMKPDVRNRANYVIKILQYAAQIDPGNQQVNLALGNAFKQVGNMQQANIYFSRAGGAN